MTTVVFRDGVLAADSLLVQGSIKCPESMNKLVMGKTHPVIYAMAGKIAILAAAVRIIEAMPVAPWDGGEFRTRPALDCNCELVAFHRDGRVVSFETDGLWFEPAEVPFMALGLRLEGGARGLAHGSGRGPGGGSRLPAGRLYGRRRRVHAGGRHLGGPAASRPSRRDRAPCRLNALAPARP